MLLVVLVLVGGSLASSIDWSIDVAAWLTLATMFTTVGRAVVSRVPRNSFGWMALAIGATGAISVGTWSADAPGVLAWVRSSVVYVPIGLLPVALLLAAPLIALVYLCCSKIIIDLPR